MANKKEYFYVLSILGTWNRKLSYDLLNNKKN